MNHFLKKSLQITTLLNILATSAYAGSLTLLDTEGNALAPVTISGVNTQVSVDADNITATINQLMTLGLGVENTTLLLLNAGLDPVAVTEAFVTAYPKLVLEIVESVTKANPNKAGDVAATAATLLPEQAADIAGAAAKQVTSIGQAHQIANKVGIAVHAQKVDGIPDTEGQAIAKAIIANAPSELGITSKALANVATRRNKITKEKEKEKEALEEENLIQDTPISPS